eukprot:1552493-Pleurochrysis_carterae.AAC.2
MNEVRLTCVEGIGIRSPSEKRTRVLHLTFTARNREDDLMCRDPEIRLRGNEKGVVAGRTHEL